MARTITTFIRERAKALGVGALFVVVIVGTLLVASKQQYSEAASIGKNVSSFQELSQRFEKLAQEKGGVYAFEVLKRAQLPPQTDLHLLGHVVGDELYKQEGVDGIRLCTQDFRNACSHAMVIGTLSEFGEGSLPKIRDACAEAPGGSGAYTMCFHGLGHGVFAGYGYELPQTIEFCQKTGTEEYSQREYIECFGGAIMELMGGGGHDPHLWEEARERYITSPLAPCMSPEVPDELRSICLTYLTPQLWEAAGIELGAPNPAQFEDAFAYCDELPREPESWRKSCYSGFGKEFVPLAGQRDIRNISSYSNSDFARAIAWCSYAGNTQGEQWCINEGLDSIFWGGENDPEASFRYCSIVRETASEEHANACEQTLARNISFYITSEEERSTLCSQIPEHARDTCLLQQQK